MKAERSGRGKTKFFPGTMPRRILSYPKIVKAERSGRRKTKFFPGTMPRRILSYPKIAKAERSGRGENEVFPRDDAEAHPILSKDSESRAQREEGKTKFFPRTMPRRILSYPKIHKAERSGRGENEVFPRDDAEAHPAGMPITQKRTCLIRGDKTLHPDEARIFPCPKGRKMQTIVFRSSPHFAVRWIPGVPPQKSDGQIRRTFPA